MFAIQTVLVAALIIGFRHSIRLPAELHARWLFHLVRPANQGAYLAGAKRAALVKLVFPTLTALLPLHVLVFGGRTALVHFAYGMLLALVLGEVSLPGYRRLPFASSYVPSMKMTTHAPIYTLIGLAGVFVVAGLERVALSTTRGTVILFVSTGTILAGIRAIDVWQRRDRREIELDELVDLPTLRLGLMEEDPSSNPWFVGAQDPSNRFKQPADMTGARRGVRTGFPRGADPTRSDSS